MAKTRIIDDGDDDSGKYVHIDTILPVSNLFRTYSERDGEMNTENDVPKIFAKKIENNFEFYLIGNQSIKLNSLTLVGAFREALKIAPNLNLDVWVDENERDVPVLFKDQLVVKPIRKRG